MLTAVTVLLAVAGCATAVNAQPGTAVEKPDLTVGIVPTTDSTGFFVALQEGR